MGGPDRWRRIVALAAVLAEALSMAGAPAQADGTQPAGTQVAGTQASGT